MEDFNKHKKYLQSFAVRGRSLSLDQNYLMQDVLKKFSASVNCERIFENIEQCERKINFEIGFGDGKNLIERATKFPEQIFIGCEVYKKGLFRVASYIKDNDAQIYTFMKVMGVSLLQKFQIILYLGSIFYFQILGQR